MYDATPIQCIAHGLVPVGTLVGPILTNNVEGVASIIRTAPGTIHITLDTGVTGGGVVPPGDARVLVTLVPNIFPATSDAVLLTPGGAVSQVVVRTWNLTTGLLDDTPFYFVVMRAPESTSDE